MSKLYLPNGGQISIQNGWKQTINADGSITYRDPEGEFLGVISSSGLVHLSDKCMHFYYPPSVSSLDDAVTLITEHHRKLPSWKAKQLKSIFDGFDARSGFWKK